jgi:hypothetical protein
VVGYDGLSGEPPEFLCHFVNLRANGFWRLISAQGINNVEVVFVPVVQVGCNFLFGISG